MRRHVHSDAQALIVVGGFSVAWVILQFVRQRRVDVVGAVVPSGFAVGVVSSTLLGGNEYVLKVRDAGFTALFGVICIVTLFTHDRPALFYVAATCPRDPTPPRCPPSTGCTRFLWAAMRPSASVLWGIGLVVEASTRMVFADVLPTGTFLAVSPFITAGVIGSLFAFTALYTKRAQLNAVAVVAPRLVPEVVEASFENDGTPPTSSPPGEH